MKNTTVKNQTERQKMISELKDIDPDTNYLWSSNRELEAALEKFRKVWSLVK